MIALGRGGVLRDRAAAPGIPRAGGVAGGGGRADRRALPEQTAESLIEAVRFFEAHERDFDPAAIRASVQRFDRPRYLEEFKAFVERNLLAGR